MEDAGATDKPIWEYVREIRELKARIAKYQERLEIDHAFRWSEADGEMVRFEIPDDERDTFPDAISCREADTKLMDLYIDEIQPIVHAAEELVHYVMEQHNITAPVQFRCPHMRKLFNALETSGRIELPDSPNLQDKID